MTKIIVLTSGGLGNQLFQIYAAHALAKKYKTERVFKIHNFSFHQAHSKKVTSIGDVNFYSRFDFAHILLKLRVVKLFSKLTGKEYIKIGCFVLLDGYFQNQKFWKEFVDVKLIRAEDKTETKGALLHIRLGDFFKNDQERSEFAKRAILEMDNQTDIITNSEEILEKSEIKEIIHLKKSRVISTVEMSPDILVKFIAEYENISSNDSTLAFWGALLGQSHLNMGDRRLNSLYLLMNRMIY